MCNLGELSPEAKILRDQIDDLVARLLLAAKPGSPQKLQLQALQDLLKTLSKPRRVASAPNVKPPSTDVFAELRDMLIESRGLREAEIERAWEQHIHAAE